MYFIKERRYLRFTSSVSLFPLPCLYPIHSINIEDTSIVKVLSIASYNGLRYVTLSNLFTKYLPQMAM